MKTHQFYDSPTALFCECDTLAQSKTISGRPSGIAAEFCGGPFRPHWPHFYENVLILPQSHDPVLRIRRAGAVKTTIIDVKGQTTMKRKRPFRSHRPSFYEQRHTHIFIDFYQFSTDRMRLRSRNAHRRTEKNCICRCPRAHFSNTYGARQGFGKLRESSGAECAGLLFD